MVIIKLRMKSFNYYIHWRNSISSPGRTRYPQGRVCSVWCFGCSLSASNGHCYPNKQKNGTLAGVMMSPFRTALCGSCLPQFAASELDGVLEIRKIRFPERKVRMIRTNELETRNGGELNRITSRDSGFSGSSGRYPLWLILLLIIMGTLSGCRGYQALEDFGVRHYPRPERELGLTVNRLPSDTTFRRIHTDSISVVSRAVSAMG